MSLMPLQEEKTSLDQIPQSLPHGNASAASSHGHAILAVDHIKWVRMIARGVRQAYNFKRGSQEESDLEATAYLTLVELVKRFDAEKIPIGGDPNCAFRGWAAIFVRCRCQREARRLRNGGTYHTRREKSQKTIIVERLKNGPDLVDPRCLVEEEENEDETPS